MYQCPPCSVPPPPPLPPAPMGMLSQNTIPQRQIQPLPEEHIPTDDRSQTYGPERYGSRKSKTTNGGGEMYQGKTCSLQCRNKMNSLEECFWAKWKPGNGRTGPSTSEMSNDQCVPRFPYINSGSNYNGPQFNTVDNSKACSHCIRLLQSQRMNQPKGTCRCQPQWDNHMSSSTSASVPKGPMLGGNRKYPQLRQTYRYETTECECMPGDVDFETTDFGNTDGGENKFGSSFHEQTRRCCCCVKKHTTQGFSRKALEPASKPVSKEVSYKDYQVPVKGPCSCRNEAGNSNQMKPVMDAFAQIQSSLSDSESLNAQKSDPLSSGNSYCACDLSEGETTTRSKSSIQQIHPKSQDEDCQTCDSTSSCKGHANELVKQMKLISAYIPDEAKSLVKEMANILASEPIEDIKRQAERILKCAQKAEAEKHRSHDRPSTQDNRHSGGRSSLGKLSDTHSPRRSIRTSNVPTPGPPSHRISSDHSPPNHPQRASHDHSPADHPKSPSHDPKSSAEDHSPADQPHRTSQDHSKERDPAPAPHLHRTSIDSSPSLHTYRKSISPAPSPLSHSPRVSHSRHSANEPHSHDSPKEDIPETPSPLHKHSNANSSTSHSHVSKSPSGSFHPQVLHEEVDDEIELKTHNALNAFHINRPGETAKSSNAVLEDSSKVVCQPCKCSRVINECTLLQEQQRIKRQQEQLALQEQLRKVQQQHLCQKIEEQRRLLEEQAKEIERQREIQKQAERLQQQEAELNQQAAEQQQRMEKLDAAAMRLQRNSILSENLHLERADYNFAAKPDTNLGESQTKEGKPGRIKSAVARVSGCLKHSYPLSKVVKCSRANNKKSYR